VTWKYGRTASLLLVAGCVSSTPIENTGPVAYGAVVGRITGPTGDGIDSAILEVVVVTQPQDGQQQILGSGQIVTGTDGTYFVSIALPGVAEQTALVGMTVVPQLLTNLASKDTANVEVKLSANTPPADTTFLDVQLAAKQ
jgi:hypothetical protein